ncbi:hypothetical protein BDW59DRAFT_33401 [Aspergillus cavernicola]|uniref:Subtelomeric hrmA-associated cluster protein AFUB-079030/YDR124W-like helical bundle domain-containing protein n=1 Tax=Aspergillus cavernicola TaxID=176166 RepID=A0ABR4IPQ0_9EURO
MSMTFPYSHFAIMYIDHRGEMQVETSSSIAGYEKAVFPEEVQERFLKLASGEWQSSLQQQSVHSAWYNPTQPRPLGLIPCEWQPFHTKRPRRGLRRVDSGVGHGWEPPSPSPSLTRSTLRVGQTKLLRSFYEKAFDCFQQLNCRVVAKAFVKLVEPRKQVNHPYNGKRNVAGSTQKLDPESTKPKWWPSGVTHKEPDHLGKPERIRLLAHILCELRESHGVTAEKLKEAGQDVRRQISPAKRLHVLDEIYYVRGMEELYLDGKISSDTTIHVSHVRIEDELQEHAHDTLASTSSGPKDQQHGHRSHREDVPIPEDTFHHLPLRRSKRPANPESYLPVSPVSSPSVSRKSSLDSSDIDLAMVSATEPTSANSPTSTRALHSAGVTSIPDYFANQFATQPAGHDAHPGFWDSLPTVHPQYAFPTY